MNELKVTINKAELPVKEYQGQRVVTLKEIDTVHERPEGTARRTFHANKKHMIEGTDYFVRNPSEAASEFGLIAPNGLVLMTESGYLMLVKSFTDDLAWAVQRQLVNTYFRATEEQRQEAARDTVKETNAAAKLNYSRAKVSALWLKIADKIDIPEYRGVCLHYASKALAGKEVIPLPAVVEKTYTAEEVGAMLGGISANKVGRIANEHGLKPPEYGVEVWDKSKHSAKQVQAWRYNDKAVERFREIVTGA